MSSPVSTLDWKILSEALLGGLPAGVLDGADSGQDWGCARARATAAASSEWAWCTTASAEAWGALKVPDTETIRGLRRHSRHDRVKYGVRIVSVPGLWVRDYARTRPPGVRSWPGRRRPPGRRGPLPAAGMAEAGWGRCVRPVRCGAGGRGRG